MVRSEGSSPRIDLRGDATVRMPRPTELERGAAEGPCGFSPGPEDPLPGLAACAVEGGAYVSAAARALSLFQDIRGDDPLTRSTHQDQDELSSKSCDPTGSTKRFRDAPVTHARCPGAETGTAGPTRALPDARPRSACDLHPARGIYRTGATAFSASRRISRTRALKITPWIGYREYQ